MVEDTFHFQVEQGELAGVRLENAYMLSRRGWPIEGTISIDADAGRFSCSIRHAGGTAPTAQLVVQVALESIGVLKLRTTLLPPREEPYNFMLELARERIRHFLQKCEDWQMFAPAVALEAREHFDTARGLLARAVLETDRTVASQLAREAIVDAVKAGELLAARYADLILHRRFSKVRCVINNARRSHRPANRAAEKRAERPWRTWRHDDRSAVVTCATRRRRV